MKIVVQRSLNSEVIVNNESIAKINKGMVLLVCIESKDTLETIKKAATKISNLRIFEDEKTSKMSLNINQINGEFLAISQFTLSWNGLGGNRPGFENSMEPRRANELFELFCLEIEKTAPVRKGVFASHMNVNINNDGPVTFCLSF